MLFHMFNMRYTNTEVVMNNHQYRKSIRKKLKDWKISNNINEKCVAHHRDDTPETRKYNAEHYERWGHNEDGTFEYGKYVVFMTLSDHIKYHHIGAKRSEETCRRVSEGRKGIYTDKMREAYANRDASGANNPMFGRHHTEESRRKMSENHKGQIPAFKGQHHTEHAKKTLSEAQHAYQEKMHKLFDAYKALNGTLKYRAFCRAIKSGEISLDNFNY